MNMQLAIGPNGEQFGHVGPGGELMTPQPVGVMEISSAERAAEAEVRAMVQSRVLMAIQRPRNIYQCRAKIIEACNRPTFAETAMYRKPVGKKDGQMQYAEGPSIRFAEEGYRALGNLWASLTVQFENADKRVLRFDLMDLESNNTDSTIITVPKTVERSFLKEGQTAISSRQNSKGRIVYLVEATDDYLQVKQGAMVAKARRDAIIRALPSDVKEDAVESIKKTLQKRDAADPQAALKRIMDAFQQDLRILPDQIEKYLGHEMAIATPAEIQSLRGVYTAIKDGDSTWAEVLKAVEEDRDGTVKANAEKAQARQDSKKKGSPAEQAKEKAGEAGKAMKGGEAPGPQPEIPAESAIPEGGTLNLE